MSSKSFGTINTQGQTSYTLVPVTRNKLKIVVELDPDDYIRFAASLMLLRERSMSGYIHRHVIDTINKVSDKFSPEQFEEAFNRKRASIEARSKQKSRERRRSSALVKKGGMIHAESVPAYKGPKTAVVKNR